MVIKVKETKDANPSLIAKYIGTDMDHVLNVSENMEAIIAADTITPEGIKTNYESNDNTNAFEDADKAKLDGIEDGATQDQTPEEIETAYESQPNTNKLTDANLTKLVGVAENATIDQTGAEISTALYLEANTNKLTDALATKLDGIEASADVNLTAAETKTDLFALADTNNFTDTLKTKLEGITDATPDGIKTAYESNANTNEFNDAEKAKLGLIEASATADQSDAEIKSAYEGNPNTNAFEDLEKTKLAGIEDAATADQSGPEIKIAYEANANTNEFNDVEKTKLGTVESNAKDDQTGAEIKTALFAEGDTNNFDDLAVTKLTGIEALATADQSDAELKSGYEANPNTNEFSDAEKLLLATLEPPVLTTSRNCVQNQEAVNQTTTPVAGMSSTIYTGDVTSNRDIDLNLDMASGDNGGLVIVKDRGNSASHFLHCSLFSTGQILQTDTTVAQTTYPNSFDSFTTTGMRLGVNTAVNNARNYIAWAHATTHKKSGTTNTGRAYECHYNPKTGLSLTLVEAGTSDGSQKIPSHLNQKTELASSKALDAATGTYISHESFSTGEFLQLDLNIQKTYSAVNDMIHVDDGVIISGVSFNPVGRFLVIQKHSVEGYSDIGIYNPSGEAGYELNLGFKAGYWLGKRLDTTGNWILEDTVRTGQFLMPDEPNAEGVSGQLSFTDTGVVFNAGGHPAWNVIGSFLYETYADTSSDGTHSQADYDEPTSPDTVNIVEGTQVSFAEGFNDNGTLDSTLTIGANMTYVIPNGTPEGKSYLYIDKLTGAIGLTQVPYVEGKSRKLADHYGTESHDGFRTNDLHSGFQSATGVISSTSFHSAGYEVDSLMNGATSALYDEWISGPTAFTGRNANHARGYEAVQYLFSELRSVEHFQLQERNNANDNSPTDYTVWLLNADGVTWTLQETVIGETNAGAGLWRSIHAVTSDGNWLGIELRITRKGASAETYCTIGEWRITTSAPKGDFYNIGTGITIDATDTEIKRVYLATLDIDSEAHASNIENYPVARYAVNDLDVYGFLQTHGNRKIIDFGVVTNNNRYVIPLPDGWDWEDCDAEAWILEDGEWFIPGWFTNDTIRYGVKGHATYEGVIVQVAVTGVRTSSNAAGGSSGSAVNTTSAPCRVILTNNGRTTDA